MPKRQIAFISIPIEALLDVIAGRATCKLPEEVPPDSKILYAYVEPEYQIVKLALSHPSFETENSTYIHTHKVPMTHVVTEKKEVEKGYAGEKLIESEEWHRDV